MKKVLKIIATPFAAAIILTIILYSYISYKLQQFYEWVWMEQDS